MTRCVEKIITHCVMKSRLKLEKSFLIKKSPLLDGTISLRLYLGMC